MSQCFISCFLTFHSCLTFAHSPHLFLLSGSNTCFAPRCSIIADVEFHFCSTGLWHILKGGLTKLTCSPLLQLTTRLNILVLLRFSIYSLKLRFSVYLSGGRLFLWVSKIFLFQLMKVVQNQTVLKE